MSAEPMTDEMSDAAARMYPGLPSDFGEVGEDTTQPPSDEAKALYPSVDVPANERRTWLDDPSRKPTETETPPRETWKETPRPKAPESEPEFTDEQAERAIDEHGETAEPDGEPAQFDESSYDSQVIDSYRETAKELGIADDVGQQLLAKIAPRLAERQQQQLADLRAGWVEQVKADNEISRGGFDENMAAARQIVERFGGVELRQVLDETGLGDHPAVVRAFVKLGRRLRDS